MLLPKERTAIWTVVLGMAIVISACGAARPRWIRAFATGMLTLAAVYFLGCLRLSYFKEWHWNAGTRPAYWTLAHYNHSFGLKRVASSWHYSAALNFYRAMAGGRDSIEPVVSASPPPPGYQAYVLHATDRQFIDRHSLRIVYEGPGEVIVAVDPHPENYAK